jgi:hypothetical protein
VIIKLFKPKAQPIELPTEPSESLHPVADRAEDPATSSTSTGGAASAAKPPHHASERTHAHSFTFDLWIARCSLLVEVIAYAAMGLVSSGAAFTLAGMGASLGAGFMPAITSVAVELFHSRGGAETGKLFGAMALLQALL